MNKDETKKMTVKETPGQTKTTEETHKPGTDKVDKTTTTQHPGTPQKVVQKTTVEKK